MKRQEEGASAKLELDEVRGRGPGRFGPVAAPRQVPVELVDQAVNEKHLRGVSAGGRIASHEIREGRHR